MPLLETKGAGSAQGFGLSLGSAERVYIEDIFSTYLYTGNSSTQTITNGIDLAGEGGLVWIKDRSSGGAQHHLTDTARGATNSLKSDATAANEVIATGLTSFGATGFSLGANGNFNYSPDTFVSWTFREQPKFFDIVTYTGTGSNRTIAHNLGSVPGCIIVKKTSGAASDWNVYHRSIGNTFRVLLNSTSAAVDISDLVWNATTPTSTVFSLGTNSGVNSSGDTYVAYLFAHDAGGFGLTGTDNVISCGSYTGNGSATGPVITLGWEPQWVLIKNASDSQNWYLLDNMRGMPVGSADANLIPNTSNAESDSTVLSPTATGFQLDTAGSPNQSGNTFIYIAIRRGPMKVPTSGTEVFEPVTRTGTGSTATITGLSFAPDLLLSKGKSAGYAGASHDRLRGVSPYLDTTATSAEVSDTTGVLSYNMNGITVGVDNVSASVNVNGISFAYWFFRRAPGFFDEVCYTGNGTTNRAITHNLSVIPEFIINKPRSYADYWEVYHKDLGVNSYIYLNSTDANGSSTGNWSSMTASAFGAGYAFAHNRSSETYVAYLFATVAGVSKVGSYTGSGTTKQIDCGFTGGARFVLIKRTDSTGDWYVYDSARGIVSGNDPYLWINSTAAEVTNTDYVDTYSAGFELSSTAPAALNANGGTYIFLAIA